MSILYPFNFRRRYNVLFKSEFSFDSAHFLYGYEGKCSNIHGHRWKVEVTVKNAFLQRNGQNKGMIMDFFRA